jgi:alkylation response protein AidB-like acyl-CoA dehydrogenase
MRSSESGSVTFADVRVDTVRGALPVGVQSAGLLDRFLVSGGFHAAASLGIAESAHAHVVATLRTRPVATLDDAHATMRLAENVVDRALALSGGAGYLAAHPLAKAYRDVRAGAFMHPLGANRAYDFLARTALGEPPR